MNEQELLTAFYEDISVTKKLTRSSPPPQGTREENLNELPYEYRELFIKMLTEKHTEQAINRWLKRTDSYRFNSTISAILGKYPQVWDDFWQAVSRWGMTEYETLPDIPYD